jgi:hypothetical protein
MFRILLAGIVGGIVIFVWSAVAHMATPLGELGIKQVSNEDRFIGAVQLSIRDAGFYYFPAGPHGKNASESARKAWEEKVRMGPAGILVVHPEGIEPISPKVLGLEFATNVMAALLAALILTQVQGGYFSRVFVVTLMGAFGVVSLLASYVIWYGFPLDYILGETITEVVGCFLAGLALAAIVRPAAPKTVAAPEPAGLA